MRTILLNFKKKIKPNRTGRMEIQAVARRRGGGEKAVSVRHGGQKQ